MLLVVALVCPIVEEVFVDISVESVLPEYRAHFDVDVGHCLYISQQNTVGHWIHSILADCEVFVILLEGEGEVEGEVELLEEVVLGVEFVLLLVEAILVREVSWYP